jgi:hypothetical protein
VKKIAYSITLALSAVMVGSEACPCEGRGPTIHEFACSKLRDSSLYRSPDKFRGRKDVDARDKP